MKKFRLLFLYLIFCVTFISCSIINNGFHKEVHVELLYIGESNGMRGLYIISNKKVRLTYDYALTLEKINKGDHMYYIVKNNTIQLLDSLLRNYPLNDCKEKNSNGDFTNFMISVYKSKKLYQCFYFRNYNEGIEFFNKLILLIEKYKKDKGLIEVFKNCIDEIEYESKYFRKSLKK